VRNVTSRRERRRGSDKSSSHDENPLIPLLLLIDVHEHHENLAANIISPHTWPLLHPGAGHVFHAGSPTERFLCRIRVGVWGCSRGLPALKGSYRYASADSVCPVKRDLLEKETMRGCFAGG